MSINLHDYCSFGDESVYVAMAIARKKDNEQITTNTEPIFREVLKDHEDIDRKLLRLRAQAENYTPVEGGDLTWRVYITANARNVVDAYYHFKELIGKWARDMYYGDDAALNKLKGVDSEWISELQRPHNRDEELFLHDIDDADREAVEEFCREMPVVAQAIQETPNGYHVVSEPFNYTEWQHPVPYELKTDGLLHVEEIKQ